jgi:hypothetical protein
MFTTKPSRFVVTVLISLMMLAACTKTNGGGSGGPGSPLKVRTSITPEPIVGRDVTWHIEMVSTGPEFQNATLRVELPEGVELVSGDPNWQGDIPAGGTVVVDLVIRVTTPGEWKISAGASAIIGPGSNAAGWKTLYTTSSETSAEVIEDIYWIGTPVPTLQIAPSNTPESTPTPNP